VNIGILYGIFSILFDVITDTRLCFDISLFFGLAFVCLVYSVSQYNVSSCKTSINFFVRFFTNFTRI